MNLKEPTLIGRGCQPPAPLAVGGIVIILVLIFMFSPGRIFCSISDDSEIENRLVGATGKERVEILSELVNAYQDINPKKAMDYGREALQLLLTFPDGKLEISILNNMSTASIWLGDFQAAENFARRSLAIAKALGEKSSEAAAIYNIGLAYWYQDRYREAEDWNSRCHNYYKKRGNKKGLAKSIQLMGSISWKLGNFAAALQYVQQSTEIYQALNDKKGIADSLNMSGIISSEAGQYQDGLDFFFKANRIYESLEDKTGVAKTLNNIGRNYTKIGKPLEALKYLRKSLDISRKMGIRSLFSTTIINFGEIYAQKKEYSKALEYFYQALKIKEELKESMWIAFALNHIGKVKRKLGKYREARQLLERALEIAKNIKIKNEIKTAAKELSEISEILGDHQKALAYYQEYKNIDEEIYNEISRKKMLEIQTLYETDQREKELTLLKKDQELQQLEQEQQNTFMNSVLAIALLILLVVFTVFMLYRLKTRTTQTLTKEIREHKQTAQKLRESEETFRTLAEKSVVGISIIQDHVIRYANPAFLTIFDCSPEDIVGQSPLKLAMKEDQALVMERLSQPISREDAADFTGYEFRGLTKKGKVIYLESYSVKTLYQGQTAVLETIIDITDRKKTEAELLKMRKLESMGILAGRIAQDFHHLITLVVDDAEKLKTFMQYDAKLFNWIGNLEKTALKATNLTQKLITFSRGGGAAEPREVDLASILKSTFYTYPQMKKWVHSVSMSPGLTTIYGDERELTQVISSLLWNAREAKDNDEELTVTIFAENTFIPPVNNRSLKAGEYIKVTVTDNGKGIPGDQLDKVFDPYFSTKEDFSQKGMGLGLAICYSIIKRHNGHISINSEVGMGTTVELILPVYKSNN
jgi:PAS domain S-box-containing protein